MEPDSKSPEVSVFRPGGDDLEKALGTLEAQVMEAVWAGEDLCVDDVREQLAQQGKKAAYTTIMTTLDRLYKKGYLERRRVGKAYRYSARVTKSELGKSVARQVLDGLLSTFAEPAVAYFVEALGSARPDQLEALAKKVDEERGKPQSSSDTEPHD
jgi:predicted transcriptional regulator